MECIGSSLAPSCVIHSALSFDSLQLLVLGCTNRLPHDYATYFLLLYPIDGH